VAKFKISTEALRGSAHELRVCAGRVAIAAECHREAGRWEAADGSLLALFQPGHEALTEMLQRRLEKDSTILSNTAHALAEVARRFDAGGADAVRLLDPEVRS
jgi:hypothetical protein